MDYLKDSRCIGIPWMLDLTFRMGTFFMRVSMAIVQVSIKSNNYDYMNFWYWWIVSPSFLTEHGIHYCLQDWEGEYSGQNRARSKVAFYVDLLWRRYLFQTHKNISSFRNTNIILCRNFRQFRHNVGQEAYIFIDSVQTISD